MHMGDRVIALLTLLVVDNSLCDPFSHGWKLFGGVLPYECLQEEPDEHGQGRWEGKQEGKSDKRITESKAQQKESNTLCTNLAY
jgi:hypothetical protein